MKRVLGILLAILPMMVAGQMVQPVHWSGEDRGDSVRIRATVEEGWHMSILEMGEFMFTQEYKDSFVMTVAKTEMAPIRFNACNDVMCTLPTREGEYFRGGRWLHRLSYWRQVAVVDFPVGIVGRIVGDIHTLCVADYSDDG